MLRAVRYYIKDVGFDSQDLVYDSKDFECPELEAFIKGEGVNPEAFAGGYKTENVRYGGFLGIALVKGSDKDAVEEFGKLFEEMDKAGAFKADTGIDLVTAQFVDGATKNSEC